MATKKWATQKEISNLLKTYSIHPNEFESFGNEGHSFKSRFTKGYVVSIEPEIQHGSEKTGRVIVSHTDGNGNRTFQDVWERDSEGKLQFRFRNPWNRPFADYDYLKDLEVQIKEFKEAGFRIVANQNIDKMFKERERMFERIKDGVDRSNQIIALLKNENQALQERVLYLEEENQKLINKTEHNARGAGRKANPQHLEAQVKKVQDLLEAGNTATEIQKAMGISRSSFFRYKKFIKNK